MSASVGRRIAGIAAAATEIVAMLWESSGLCAERSSISSTSLRRSRDCGRSDPNASCRAAGQPSPRRCCLEHLALGDDRDSAGFPECPANRQRPSAGRPWLLDLGSGVQPDARRAMTGSRDNTAWVRDLSGSSPRERTLNAEGASPTPGYRPMPPFPWCFPVTPIRLPVRPI